MTDETVTTINIAPTWRGLLPALLMVLEHGNATGRAHARAELQRMAELADMVAAGYKESENE